MAIGTEIVTVEKVKRGLVGKRDEYLEITVDKGWTFAGAKERNFYRERGGEERTRSWRVVPGAILRVWGGLGYPVHQIEVETPEGWFVVWDTTNDFGTIEESKASGDAYAAFIEAEGDALASRIDEGMEPAEAEKQMGDGHSGNTAAWAWRLGTERAKNTDRAQAFRDYWNAKWAPDQDVAEGGLVNPAVLTISAG